MDSAGLFFEMTDFFLQLVQELQFLQRQPGIAPVLAPGLGDKTMPVMNPFGSHGLMQGFKPGGITLQRQLFELLTQLQLLQQECRFQLGRLVAITVRVLQFQQVFGTFERLLQRGVGIIDKAGLLQRMQTLGLASVDIAIRMPLGLQLTVIAVELRAIKLATRLNAQRCEIVGHCHGILPSVRG